MRSNLTVGIPCYNCSDTIERTLLSIYKQSEKPYEIIFVDDNSSEEYEEIFLKFPDLNIKYIKLKENKGIGFVRSVIVDNTKTSFLTMIDADDYFYFPEVFSFLNYHCSIGNFDLLTTPFLKEEKNSDIKIYPWTYVGCHGKVYNLNFFKRNNINFPNLRLHEEGFVNRILYRVGKVVHIENPIYFWAYNKKSQTRQEDPMLRYFIEYCESFKKEMEYFKEYNIEYLISIFTFWEQIRLKYPQDLRLKKYKKYLKENFIWDYDKIKNFQTENNKRYLEIIKHNFLYDVELKNDIFDFIKES